MDPIGLTITALYIVFPLSYFYTHAQGDILGYSSVESSSLSRESEIQEIINHKALT